MIENNFRLAVERFFTPPPTSEAYSMQLISGRDKKNYIDITAVPGNSLSNIEKMTHPLAGESELEQMSPYLLFLLGEPRLVAFAEKVCNEPRKRLLDKLGIDDTSHNAYRENLMKALKTVTRFYPRTAVYEVQTVRLNDQPFLIQRPTRPYFEGQRLITPDFTLFRKNQQDKMNRLLACRLRDDSGIHVNKQPIIEINRYVNEIRKKEYSQRVQQKYVNDNRYFIEMIDYLSRLGMSGDILAQNSLDCSSDQHTPHFQFIPGNISFPLFLQKQDDIPVGNCGRVDWPLSTLFVKLDTAPPGWKKKIAAVQQICQQLYYNQCISTLPVFRRLADASICLYLIFKKDGTSHWQMAPDEVECLPGWLEACGIFISGTPKSDKFNALGAQRYYGIYSLEEKTLAHIRNTLGEILSGKETSPE